MAKLQILFVGYCLIGSSCGGANVTKSTGKPGSRSKTSAVEVVSDRTGSESDADATKEDTPEEKKVKFEQVEAEITTEEMVSVKTYNEETPPSEDEPVDDPKEQEPIKIVERESLIVTTIKKDERNVLAFVKVGNEPYKELLWPNGEGTTAANEGICIKGTETLLSFKMYSQDEGDMFPGSEEVALLDTLPDTLSFGYEENGCDDDRCQDDNIIQIRCPSGIKLSGAM